MTQSGQGEEPSRPAREGIVLPSDGGEPLLPGALNQGGAGPVPPGGALSGGPPPGGAVSGVPRGTSPPAAPPGAQAWDQPWGPDQPAAPPADQPWQAAQDRPWAPAQQESAPWTDPPPSHPGPGPLPPEAARQPYGDAPTYDTPNPYDSPRPYDTSNPYGAQRPAGNGNGTGTAAPYDTPQPYGAPAPSAPLPPAQAQAQAQSPYGQHQHQHHAQGPHQGFPPAPQGAADPATQYLPPVQDLPAPPAQTHGDPLPPAHAGPMPGQPAHGGAHAAPRPVDEAATQFIPPVPAGPAPESAAEATQYLPSAGLPRQMPAADEGATQLLPPVGPGALPPEVPQGGAGAGTAERTTFLGRAPQRPAPGGGSDSEATQFIPPVTGGAPGAAPGRSGPPAEFAGLFREEPGESPAASTQQMPRFPQPGPDGPGTGPGQAPRAGAPYAGSGGRGHRAGRDDNVGRRADRGGSRVPLLAAIGVGIAVVGVGAGALMGGGGGDKDEPKTVSAEAPAPSEEASPSPSVDPVRAQAVELDKLLADSGNSRTTVINAVADVKSCKNLGQAAEDLRGAAKQRNDLVTRLSGLTVDKLPDTTELTTALTKAWQASAAADDHYAAWADEVAGNKKSCRKGEAKATGSTRSGNRQSGTATAEKEKAARLWNPIAKQHGLTERTPTQL